MRFDRLLLTRFGKFTDQEIALPRRERDFHVIVGPNEAGKSTVRAAILDVLFGIPKNTVHGFLHPMPTMRLGAALSQGGSSLYVERVKALRNTLRTATDELLPEQALFPYLGSTDRDFFVQMFSLDHARLVSGGESMLSASNDIGQLLFQSAAGLSSLGSARDALEAQADSLWSRRRSADRLYYQASDALEAANAALKSTSLRAKEFAAASEQVEQLDTQLSLVRQQHHALRNERSQLERVRRLAPQLERVDRLLEQFEAIKDAVLLSPDATSIVQQVQESLASHAYELRHSSEQLDASREALQGLSLDRQVLERRAAIDAISERRVQLAGHPQELADKRIEIAHLQAQVAVHARALGWESKNVAQVLAALPDAAQRQRLAALIVQQPQLTQLQSSTQKALASRREEWLAAQARVQTLDQVDEPLALRVAVGQAQSLGQVAERQAQLQAEVARAQRHLAQAMEALGAWPKSVAQLRGMTMPDRNEISRLAKDGQDREFSMRELQRRQVQLESAIADLQAELQHTEVHFSSVTTQIVSQARRQRDALWADLREQPERLTQLADGFEMQMHQADRLADQRMDQTQRAADLQAGQAKLSALQNDALTLQREQSHWHSLEQGAQRAWLALTSTCQVPALPVSAAASWMDARAKVLDADSALQEAVQTLSDFSARVEQAQQALFAALQLSPGDTSRQPLGFSMALLLARERLERFEQNKGERRALEAQRVSDQRELEQLQVQLQDVQADLQVWTAQWAQALQAVGHAQDASCAQVGGFLELCDKLRLLALELDQLQQRDVLRLQAQLEAFDQATRSLAAELEMPFDGLSADAIARSLAERLRAALTQQQEQLRLQAQMRQSEAECAQLGVRAERAKAALTPLFAVAGVQALEPLLSQIARSEQKRVLSAKLEQALVQIEQASDGFSLEQVRDQCRVLQGQDLAVRAQELASDDHDLLANTENLAARKQEALAQLQMFSGAAHGAVAEAQRQEALAAMTQVSERYIAVHTAARLLRWSVDRYRQQMQGPMLTAASQVFQQLTLGAFNALVVDFDAEPPILLGRRVSGQLLRVNEMSEGTRDQLYLALRMAAIDLHVQQAQPLPFVADDLFINFDDGRSAAGLAALGELSRHTQVIFLTHHSHLVPVVERVFADGVNIVRL